MHVTFRAALMAAVASGSFALARPAAAQYDATSANIPFADEVTIDGTVNGTPIVNESVYVGEFNVTFANGVSEAAFCVDLIGVINASYNYLTTNVSPPPTYQTQYTPAHGGPTAPNVYGNPTALTPTLISGVPLTATQIQEMESLASYGFALSSTYGSYPVGNPTPYERSAAVQIAIWSIEYGSDVTFSYADSLPGTQSYVNFLLANEINYPVSSVAALVDASGSGADGTSQALLIMVPEPTSIALFGAGLAGLFLVARRRPTQAPIRA